MTSTLVHLAIGALLAAALLEDEFDARALGIVLAATAFPDLDTFIGLAVEGTHRAALHNLFVPLVLSGLLLYDTRYREDPWLATPRAVRLAWVALAGYVFAGIAPDLFTNGANLLFPFHDQFVSLQGHVWYSDQRGFLQTIWETRESTGGRTLMGTTESVHYATGVDPTPGPDPPEAERIFPLFDSGLQLLLIVLGVAVPGERLRRARKA